MDLIQQEEKPQEAIPFDTEVDRDLHGSFLTKDVCGFAEHEENATYGIGYKLFQKTKDDIAVI